jgi:hypothetical protein
MPLSEAGAADETHLLLATGPAQPERVGQRQAREALRSRRLAEA